MQNTNSTNPLQQNCLNHLQTILDLVMRTAEAASVEKNHKLVLQAVREVTRIITLMNKMSAEPDPERKSKTPTASSRAKIPQLPGQYSKAAAMDSDQEMKMVQEIFSNLLQSGDILPGSANQKQPVLEVGKNREMNGKNSLTR
jgi:hypothetical protein